MQSFLDKIAKNFNHNLGPHWQSKKYVLAVSGGPDSMALLGICIELNLNITVCHINYKQRGANSDAEERLLLNFCQLKNIECHVKTWTLGKNVASFQENARNFRYQFFNEKLFQINADCILTAHHAQDRVETMIYNLSRGAGLAGMSSIPTINKNIFRPLLICNKEELQLYLEHQQISYGLDASNLKDEYKRNFIRLNIIPNLKSVHPKALENFLQSAQIAENAQKELNTFYGDIYSKATEVVSVKPKIIGLRMSDFIHQLQDIRGFFSYILHEVFQNKEIGRAHV